MNGKTRLWRWIGVGTGAVVLILALLILWVVPIVIQSRVEAIYAGKITFGGWWVGSNSIGLRNVVLHEGGRPGGDPWLEVGRVETDLTLSGIMRGHFLPKRIVLDQAVAHLRFAKSGEIITKITLNPKANDARAALPTVVLANTTVHLQQDGRATFTVGGMNGQLAEGSAGLDLKVQSSEPDWAPCQAEGTFTRDFKSGRVSITSARDIEATLERMKTLPWIPPETWENVAPDGPIGARINLTIDERANPPFQYEAIVDLHSIRASLPTLKLKTEKTTGRVRCVGPVVHAENLQGGMLGGRASGSGTLDFTTPPARFDLKLDLAAIDVESAPAAWQLDKIGATGKLSGKVHLLAQVSDKNVDLTGSSGEAHIDNATLQGFPVKLFRLAMKAKGQDLQFESPDGKKSSLRDQMRNYLPVWLDTVQPAPQAQGPKIELPKTITTQVEFEDIDLGEVINRVTTLTRIKIPIRMGGKASLKARATIPLRSIRSIKEYEFHGQAKLMGAVIEGVDFGRVDATLDLENGVLRLTDFRGQLLDRPAGIEAAPPAPTEAMAMAGPLPPGGFRGTLKVELDPPGGIDLNFESVKLPVGEITAPLLPRPNPLAGNITGNVKAHSNVFGWERADAWTIDGKLSSESLRYRDAQLDRLTTSIKLADGRLSVPDLDAELEGDPLKINARVDMKAPQPFHAEVTVRNWHLAKVLPFVPDIPSPAPVDGRLDATAKFDGTLKPFSVLSEGTAKLGGLIVERLPFGDVPIAWRTEGDEIVLTQLEAHPFGGTISGDGRIPSTPVRPARLALTIAKVDTALIAKAALGPDAPPVSGTFDGRLNFLLRPGAETIEGELALQSNSLNFRGVSLAPFVVKADAKDGKFSYKVTSGEATRLAQLDGSIAIKELFDGLLRSTDGRFLALNYSIQELQRLAGLATLPAGLTGVAGIDANLRLVLIENRALGLNGVFQARELTWNREFPLGHLKGNVARTPGFWRIDQISGELLGGPISGAAWNEPKLDDRDRGLVRFDLRVDRASLARVLGFIPDLANQVTGTGSVRLTGRYAQGATVAGEVLIPKASILAIPIVDLKIPLDMTLEGDGSTGTLRARQFFGRISGGHVRGDASMRIGENRNFNIALALNSVDMETITKTLTSSARPGSGKVSGKIQLQGPDPSTPVKYRGRVDLDLDDASLFEVPILRELERFLGASRGGLIEDGDLHGAIANRQLIVESMTLEGRLFQIHASGTISIDGTLSLEVLVNTNQIIPETGQALIARIPGLGEVIGRNEQAMVRVAQFLTNRLLKFRISGTIKNPIVQVDPAVVVTSSAIGFFSSALKLPIGLIR